jgi:hypothetical protein
VPELGCAVGNVHDRFGARATFLCVCFGKVIGEAHSNQLIILRKKFDEALPVKYRDLPAAALNQTCALQLSGSIRHSWPLKSTCEIAAEWEFSRRPRASSVGVRHRGDPNMLACSASGRGRGLGMAGMAFSPTAWPIVAVTCLAAETHIAAGPGVPVNPELALWDGTTGANLEFAPASLPLLKRGFTVRHTSGQFGAGVRDAGCRTLKYVKDVRFEACYHFLLWRKARRTNANLFLQSRIKTRKQQADIYEQVCSFTSNSECALCDRCHGELAYIRRPVCSHAREF